MSLFSLVLAGCANENEVEGSIEPISEFVYSPASLDFGAQPTFQEITQVIMVTNTGETELVIVDETQTAPAHVIVQAPYPPVLSPGQSGNVSFTWTPTSTGQLNDTVPLWIGETRDSVKEHSIPIHGSGQGAVMTLSSSEYNFGKVDIGCKDSLNVTVTNSGNEPLHIDHIDLQADISFALEKTEPLPWTLNPFQSKSFDVSYAPTTLDPKTAVIELGNKDHTSFIQLEGVGHAEGEETMTIDIESVGRSTVLFHVNACAIPNTGWGYWGQRFEDSLPIFFQTLLDHGGNFRVGFIWDERGTLDGDYIDETYTVARATNAAISMLQGGTATDNDRSFSTLVNAIAENEDWLITENVAWADSKLSLIAINRDTEQSFGAWSNYISQAQDYKTDSANLVFHAIGGTPTSMSCGAEPFTTFQNAVTATDGIFLDLCEPDWDDHMKRLAGAATVGTSTSGSTSVPLTGTPLVSSISVSLDGNNLPTGWTYDPGLNAIVFDGEYALAGTRVEIYYRHSNTCG